MYAAFLFIFVIVVRSEPRLRSWCAADARCADLYHLNNTSLNDESSPFDVLLKMRLPQTALEPHFGPTVAALDSETRRRLWVTLLISAVPRTCDHTIPQDAGVSCVSRGSKLVFDPSKNHMKCVNLEQSDETEAVHEHWHTSPLMAFAIILLFLVISFMIASVAIFYTMRIRELVKLHKQDGSRKK